MFPRPENTFIYIKDPRLISDFHLAHSNSILCTIKLGKPLDLQLLMIKEEAKKLERNICGRSIKTIKVLKPDLWIKYIRILDARICNVKPKIIQDILFKPVAYQTAEDKYREVLRQAKKMVSEGYKDLVGSIFYYS
jgi:hypothetical protein